MKYLIKRIKRWYYRNWLCKCEKCGSVVTDWRGADACIKCDLI